MNSASARRAGRAGAWLLAAAGAFLASRDAGGAAARFRTAVPPGLQADRVRAILAVGPGRTPEDARRRAEIVRAKWTGFSRAHGIVFPASIDADGALAGLARSGAGVLVFDERAGTLRRFLLPVPARALEDIVRILLD